MEKHCRIYIYVEIKIREQHGWLPAPAPSCVRAGLPGRSHCCTSTSYFRFRAACVSSQLAVVCGGMSAAAGDGFGAGLKKALMLPCIAFVFESTEHSIKAVRVDGLHGD